LSEAADNRRNADDGNGARVLHAVPRARAHAGSGERIPAEVRLVFENPADLIHVLSTERIRVLRAVRTKPISVSQLVNELQRDRQAVMRDVRLLESFGLLETREAPNPGHGTQRIVARLAARYQLVANI
jgi:predicted transcriptional regulator